MNTKKQTGQVRLEVNHIFAKTGSAMPMHYKQGQVIPREQALVRAEKRRLEFDRPDDLIIGEDGFGGVYLAHKRDEAYHKRRQEVAKEVLARHGIKNVAELGALPEEQARRLLSEMELEFRT